MNRIFYFFLFPCLCFGAAQPLDTAFLSLEPTSIGEAAPSMLPRTPQAHSNFVAALSAPGWSAPAVWADTENKRVLVWGEATGMGANEPVEFFVVGHKSGYDYESLMTCFAKPSDVHRALEAIGCAAGAPVNVNEQRFWPRGARIRPRVHFLPPHSNQVLNLSLYDFVQQKDHSPVPEQPWVFVGSRRVPNPETPDTLVYAADVFSPNSIASTFNLINTVFDLPQQGSKTGVYGDTLYHPVSPLPTGHPMLLELIPDTSTRILDERLTITADDTTGKASLVLGETPFASVNSLSEHLEGQDHDEIHINLCFGPKLRLIDIATAAQSLSALESSQNPIRFGPPVEGQLFFKAFLPQALFRDRSARPSQPWELHLSSGETPAILFELEEKWGDALRPQILEQRYSLTTPSAWQTHVTTRAKDKHVLFVYAPLNTTHERLQEWISPIINQFPVIYVFGEQ